MPQVVCENCHNIFTKSTYQIKKVPRHFCSRKCANIKHSREKLGKGWVTFKCNNCKKEKKQRKWSYNRYSTHFCSAKCKGEFKTKTTRKVRYVCQYCQKETFRMPSELNKNSKHYFCSVRCACRYNQQKSHTGTQQSYPEAYLVQLLQKDYPTLTIIQNDRTILNGLEIDIYIPELNFGIEYNGVFHQKPIFGSALLRKTIQKDKRKQSLACKKGLVLYVVLDNLAKTKPKQREFVFTQYTKEIRPLMQARFSI